MDDFLSCENAFGTANERDEVPNVYRTWAIEQRMSVSESRLYADAVFGTTREGMYNGLFGFA